LRQFFAGDFMRRRFDPLLGLSLSGVFCLAAVPLLAQTATGVLEGRAAFGDWRVDRPGLRRLIKPHDLPPPQPKESVANMVRGSEPIRSRSSRPASLSSCSPTAWPGRA
jgi:hypothetical protein